MKWIKNVVIKLGQKHKTTDPFELASLLSIEVVPWDLHKEIRGFYKYDKRNKFIFINSNLNWEIQRFVCAHELGHALLHPRSNTPFYREKTLFSIEKIEVEANSFAVELLMPDEILTGFNHTNLSLDEIGEICGIPKGFSQLKEIEN
ncbi:ImmA/IrrE family metallo-endopeptidase [Peribacillus sp. B-H-3]|uniref:ImmA/IrrE family metallo-endopeptidase n=1 Tax=Peribacillus sp. B-H-3 TaxID=3400420 RepID=UPI003B014FDD